MKLTPILIVEEIESLLPFWIDRIGFQKTAEVPEGDKLAFVMMARDGIEVMLQTAESVKKDIPAFAPDGPSAKGTALYIEVEDFEDVKRRLEGYPIGMPERVAFYGMREIGLASPSGHTVIFAAKA